MDYLALGGGAHLPFLVAAGLNLLNFAFGVFVLPESLPLAQRRNVELKRLNPFTSLVKILKPSPILLLVWVYFLIILAGQVHPANWTLYTQLKFGWTAWQVGVSLTFVGLTIAISQGLLTRILIPRFGEQRALTLGICMYVVTFALFGLVTQGWMMYLVMALFSLTGIAMPALQAIVSRHVPANEQGELQGSLVALASLSSFLGPLLFTYLFVEFTKIDGTIYFPGAAYIGASVICAFTLLLRLTRKTSLTKA